MNTSTEKPIVVCFGEILWDMFPEETVLGGAPTNVAWHAAQLGATAHIISAVGKDDLGRKAADVLQGMQLGCDTVTMSDAYPTGTVVASIADSGDADYRIAENVAWDHIILTDAAKQLLNRAAAFNFGSLAQRGEYGEQVLQEAISFLPAGALIVFDVNLREPFINHSAIRKSMKHATIVKMNEFELPLMRNILGVSSGKTELDGFFEAFPQLKLVVVTQGGRGVLCNDGIQEIEVEALECGSIVDTVGAGDSVTATVILGLLHGQSTRTILRHAMQVADHVCSVRGGTPVLPESLCMDFTAELPTIISQ